MAFSDEYSPFLNWTPTAPITADSVLPVFISLVSMVRDGFQFDVTLLRKLPKPHWTVCGFDGCAHVFTPSIDIREDSQIDLQIILSTPHLRDLSGIDDQNVMTDILEIFDNGVWLSSPDSVRSLSNTLHNDPESIRNVVLHEVFIPIEPSLVQISRNPHILSWGYEFERTLRLLCTIFEVSAFHQQSVDFVCSSCIPIALQSFISAVEHEHSQYDVLQSLFNNLNKWKMYGYGESAIDSIETADCFETTLRDLDWGPAVSFASGLTSLAELNFERVPVRSSKSSRRLNRIRVCPSHSKHIPAITPITSSHSYFIEMREDTSQPVCGVGSAHGDLCWCLVTMTKLGWEDFGWDEGSGWALVVASTFSAASPSITADCACAIAVHPSITHSSFTPFVELTIDVPASSKVLMGDWVFTRMEYKRDVSATLASNPTSSLSINTSSRVVLQLDGVGQFFAHRSTPWRNSGSDDIVAPAVHLPAMVVDGLAVPISNLSSTPATVMPILRLYQTIEQLHTSQSIGSTFVENADELSTVPFRLSPTALNDVMPLLKQQENWTKVCPLRWDRQIPSFDEQRPKGHAQFRPAHALCVRLGESKHEVLRYFAFVMWEMGGFGDEYFTWYEKFVDDKSELISQRMWSRVGHVFKIKG
ncbi:hypothetical protein BLNAU_10178 [Blattamonas nauphoetae]|uniref:Uncharacterized protein n=1 Tax=Blattamonas nauphoetae TaxID=2049346 RepID=A0ABQ9XTP3_9EUKA|nr:hypothetical protein BLNAU_10178 [Blattamonas nauphoetae]